MSLKVIGAGLGRTSTMSLKVALEQLGFGPCYHMVEVFAHAPESFRLWEAVVRGEPDWEAVFDGFAATVDYPGCTFWRELVSHYPDAKVILSTRDAERWFESGAATVFSDPHRARFESNPMMAEFFRLTVFDDLENRLGNREKMVEYFNTWNQAVIDEVPAEKLLVHRSADGWGPLCEFLGVPVPPEPYPRVNSREEMTERTGQLDEHAEAGPPPPEVLEAMVRGYLDDLRKKAFPATAA